ncbi:DUF6338 family protein [Shewanella sp. Isolate13]|uniref:DUF6338 family protein n=1 Tax=Shewanella sp. Isolate13 TaxID=2908531 RepID=UPI001EFC3525|nr:DUF6338 family protein [Shewanella sp. Isolate13]MCG9731359.1 DUF6338 family protein [Shewanella sp. Isolate13]
MNNVKLIFDVLIYSFLSFVIVDWLYSWEPIFSINKSVDNVYTYTASSDVKAIALTLISSVFLPIVVGAFLHHDLHMRVLRFLKVTNKTSRDTAWDDVFTNTDRYITVHLKNGNRLTGWPMYYSNSPDEGFLYIYEPAWVDDDNQYLETNSHGVLVNKDEIEFVEFLKQDDERGNESE